MAQTILDGTGSAFEAKVDSGSRLWVNNRPSITYYDDIALGNVPNAEIRPVTAFSSIGEGVGSEQAMGDGMTTRYPFPSVAAKMDIVSDDTDDTLTGSGARVILVRGNITDNVELFEAVPLSGTTTIKTTNDYFRVNSIGVVSVGAGSENAGTITLKNGTDLLAQINPGRNSSLTSIYTPASGVTGLLQNINFIAGKDDGAIAFVHIKENLVGGIDFSAFQQAIYQNQVSYNGTLPFAITPGTDFEITAYSLAGTGSSDVGVVFDILLVE